MSASCNNLIDEWQCQCLDGWDGEFCDQDIDECASGPCDFEGSEECIFGLVNGCFALLLPSIIAKQFFHFDYLPQKMKSASSLALANPATKAPPVKPTSTNVNPTPAPPLEPYPPPKTPPSPIAKTISTNSSAPVKQVLFITTTQKPVLPSNFQFYQ